MDAVIKNRLSRRSGPEGGPTVESAATLDFYSPDPKDIGYDDIYDPGPPQITCPGVVPLLIPLNASPSTSPTSSKSATTPSASVIASPSALPSETATTIASITNATPANAITSESDKLNSGARAAIGVCAALATVSLAIALFFMRRRRRNARGYRRTSAAPAQHNTRTDSESPQTAHMPPFLTPPASSSSKTTPSTPPPLRLSDRRYLPPLPPRTTTTTATTPPSTPPAESATSEGSMNASPRTITISFPRAPASAPTTSRLGPRHERRATTTAQSSIRLGAPNSSSTIPETVALRRSTSSNESGTGRTALSPLSPSSSSIYPARPPRPHAGPVLEIPDLVTPAGPPPTWALPRPPPTTSPSSSTSSLQLPHRLHPYAPPPVDHATSTSRRVIAALSYPFRLAPFLYALPYLAGGAVTTTVRHTRSNYCNTTTAATTIP
ncbi:hypothetical protein PG984_006398 [Apiospora sp. TS-2023a]